MQRCAGYMKIAKFLALLLCGLALGGCTTPTITNLTSSQQPRNTNGLYSFEAAWESRQHSIRKDSIQPSVIIGAEAFPMRPGPVLKNRWETLVPVPPDRKFVYYRYKFDFEYDSIPQKRASSSLSPPYKLEIVDK